ncbi:sensor histidine kinase [Aquimarina algicola]|uniref:Signal transduction histidine kinase internal region domain-containing protein n=1 Tax=Aquimarina algicola TaxID=2589995 RepID=A0A504J5J2_9FLAO|nr:sensor histidine kinase [Aquimarina algicola]TPN86176.1 hypothetical protein FHK87_12965 [Aquimarina algicola]
MNKVLSLLLFFTSLLYSQHPCFYHLTEKDGLPDFEFYDMLLDSNGFLWLAANNGLFRYDGKTFRSYTNSDNTGLSVFGLFEDKQQRIWCNNLAGQIFYVENDTLNTFIDISHYTTAERVHEFAIFDDHLYINSNKELFQININTRKIDFLRSGNCDNKDCQTFSLKKIKDQLWYRKGEKSKVFTILSRDRTRETVDIPFLYSRLFKTTNHTFLTSGHYTFNKKLYYWDQKSQRYFEIKFPKHLQPNRIVDIKEDNKGFIWLSTNIGAIRFKWKGNEAIGFKHLFPNKFVSRVIQDYSGHYWFSTIKNGIYIIPNLDIISYTTQNSRIATNEIRSLTKDSASNLYYSIDHKGFGKIDIQKDSVYPFTKFSKHVAEITKLEYEKDYNMLVSLGHGNNLYTIEGKERLISEIGWKDYKILSNDLILFSSIKGSGIKRNNFIEHKGSNSDIIDYEKIFRKKRSYVNHYNKKEHKIYIGYIDGLFVYDKKYNEKKILYNNQPIFTKNIKETDDGTIWVSTHKYGLLGIKNDEIVEHYDNNNGLSCIKIRQIETDGNHVWVSTDKALQFLKRDSKNRVVTEITTIDRSDGLQALDILDMQVIKDKLFLATLKGLIQINTEQNFNNQISPLIAIDQIKINQRDTILKNSYTLPYDTNVNISFNSTSFLNPSVTKKFKYRLKGSDIDWITTTSQQVQYSSFPPGQYIFEAKAVNHDGIESVEAQKVTFKILPPYWVTWWFYVLIAIAATPLLLIYFTIRIKKIKYRDLLEQQKKDTELELINSKLTALQSQMNPHFLFNALNSIQEFILNNQKYKASDYLSKFADLVRIYLEYSKRNMINLEEEIETLQLYLELENARFNDEIEYDIEVEDDPSIMICQIPPLLIQPYVENAIKHGFLHKEGIKKLEISFSFSKYIDNNIICKIRDNGIGREASMQINHANSRHNSFATEAGKTRLELLKTRQNRRVGVQIIDLKKNTIAIGTEVIIRIPIIKNHENRSTYY